MSSWLLPKVKSSRIWFCDAVYGEICAKAFRAEAFSRTATAGAVTATCAAFVTTSRRDGGVGSVFGVLISSAMNLLLFCAAPPPARGHCDDPLRLGGGTDHSPGKFGAN